MKTKADAPAIATDDPLYDLFRGGYLSPEKFLEDDSDVGRVNDAMNTVNEYLELLANDELLEEM
jgi:hypothetical protein